MIFEPQNFYQGHCLILGKRQEQLDDDFVFHVTDRDGTESLMLCNEPSGRKLVPDGKIKISELMVSTGMISGKNEFRRKLREGAITYNDQKIEQDFDVDCLTPSVFNVVRFGRKMLEWVVPLGTDWVDEECS